MKKKYCFNIILLLVINTTFSQAPAINSFNPSFGCSGTSVNIKGSNFTGTTVVSFGGVNALSFHIVSDSSIVAVVGATNSGKINVVNPNGTALSKSNFAIGNSVTTSAYITNTGDNTVSVINTNTGLVTATIPVGSQPEAISVSADGNKVYVANNNSNNVSVINTLSNTVIATIPVGTTPKGICISPDNNLAYITNLADGTVDIINTISDTIITMIDVGVSPIGICISPSGNNVYVANFSSNTVSVISTLSNTVTATIKVGSTPKGICISPDGSLLYVVNSGGSTISVINTSTNLVVATILVGTLPEGICISPDGNYLYVANQSNGNISVINTATRKVTLKITVGSTPGGLSISPDGSYLYVANYSVNTIGIVNTSTNTLIATIPVGLHPSAFGNFVTNIIAPCSTGITISGSVKTPMGKRIQNVSIKVKDSTSLLRYNTDSTGFYSAIGLLGKNYIAIPEKNNDGNKANGVTALDLALIQSHILGKTVLNSPYKIIAADVNKDNKITTLDLVYVKRLILGIDTVYPSKTLWTFVDSSFKFADSTNPFPFKDSISYLGLNASQINQTFIGIKLGDVNWDWNPALARFTKSVFIKPKGSITF